MSKKISKEELQKRINECIASLNAFLTSLNNDEKSHKKAMLLVYWILDYIKMIKNEKTFNPNSLLKYNRGDIVSINFGFRIGSELGGRHFAIVLDKFNSKHSDVLTVVPLISLKKDFKENIFSHVLNKGLYELHDEKYQKIFEQCKKDLKTVTDDFNTNEKNELPDDEYNDYMKRIDKIDKKLDEAKNLKQKLLDLKEGSVVSLGQVVTISKLRLLNPKSTRDSLYNIKISQEDMIAIQEKLNYLYNS